MAVLEVWLREQREMVELGHDRFTVGRSDDNDYRIDDDTVSRHHVLLKCVSGVWFVQDLGTLNGTIVNRRRIAGEKELAPCDELVLGKTKMVFRDATAADPPTADVDHSSPKLTRMEHVIVKELVRPMLSTTAHPRPASVVEIAARTCTTKSNVKGHLGRIYPKFGIYDDEFRRTEKRAELARRVLAAGIVQSADVKPGDTDQA
jgi:hypothetical protein